MFNSAVNKNYQKRAFIHFTYYLVVSYNLPNHNNTTTYSLKKRRCRPSKYIPFYITYSNFG